MAHPEEIVSLTKAFSGFGVDEKVLISTLAKWRPEHIESYRKANIGEYFQEDERQFQRWSDHHVQQLHQQFIRFKNAVVLRTMHPWERDARLINEALHHKGGGPGPTDDQLNVIVEIACTRTSDELLGARKAYHSLFHHSIEEEVAAHIHTIHRKLLVALVSAYRYEGLHVDQVTAKSEAKILHQTIKIGGAVNPIQEEKVILILATRSKPHISAIFNHYKEISGNNLDEDLDGHIILKQTVQCLCKPETYFSKVLENSFDSDADENAKDAVTRVILTQADANLKHIKEEYHNKTGTDLSKRIEEVANGSYRDFLLGLLGKE